MVILTKLDGTTFMLNDDLIETVNETPDTVIVLENGHSYIVRESIRENIRQRRRARFHPRNDSEPLT